jgi:hypothetical protein
MTAATSQGWPLFSFLILSQVWIACASQMSLPMNPKTHALATQIESLDYPTLIFGDAFADFSAHEAALRDIIRSADASYAARFLAAELLRRDRLFWIGAACLEWHGGHGPQALHDWQRVHHLWLQPIHGGTNHTSELARRILHQRPSTRRASAIPLTSATPSAATRSGSRPHWPRTFIGFGPTVGAENELENASALSIYPNPASANSRIGFALENAPHLLSRMCLRICDRNRSKVILVDDSAVIVDLDGPTGHCHSPEIATQPTLVTKYVQLIQIMHTIDKNR